MVNPRSRFTFSGGQSLAKRPYISKLGRHKKWALHKLLFCSIGRTKTLTPLRLYIWKDSKLVVEPRHALQVVHRSPRCDHAAPGQNISCGIEFCSLNANELNSEYI